MSGRGPRYCRGTVKRALDLIIAVPAIVLLAPLLVALSVIVLVTMGSPVFFAQERVGLDGRRFRLLKFRTMRAAEGGIPITGRGDPRVTSTGRVLRVTKLDELPQLFNIVAGRMSFVGPRPEVPKYVARYSPIQQQVLRVRPGLTDPASLEFRNEEEILGAVPIEQRESLYMNEVLPRKLQLNLQYIENASLAYDLRLIARTATTVVFGVAP